MHWKLLSKYKNNVENLTSFDFPFAVQFSLKIAQVFCVLPKVSLYYHSNVL